MRLQALLRRVPSLLSNEQGQILRIVGGDVDEARRSQRELLPLPSPRCQLIRPEEMETLFPSTGVLGPAALTTGAAAWHHLIVAALTVLTLTAIA